MLDRLSEFISVARLKGNDAQMNVSRLRAESVFESESSQVNLGKQANKEMKAFHAKAKQIQSYIQTLAKATEELRNIRQQLQITVIDKLQGNFTQILKKMYPIQKKITQMSKEIQDEIAENQVKYQEINDPTIRQMLTLQASLMNKLNSTLDQFFQQQVLCKNQQQDKIKSRIKVVKPDIEDEQLEELAQDPQAAKQLIKQKIVGKGVHISIKNAVQDIESKHQGIIALSNSIEQLHRMFLDVQMLVNSQGQTINTIAGLVSKAKNYLDKGLDNMRDAKKAQQRAQRCKCYILICVLVLLFIIVFPVIMTQAL